MDDLVERVARLIAESCERLNVPPRDIARSIIPIVYEDAAKVMDERSALHRKSLDLWDSYGGPPHSGREMDSCFWSEATDGAQAIRSRSMTIVGES